MQTEQIRKELYEDPDFKQIIGLILDLKEILPKFDSINGYIYPELAKFVEGKEENTAKILEKMATAQVLDKKLYDIELRCPKCKNPNFSTKYLCPFCESMEIFNNLLVEHISCGKNSTLSNLKQASIFDFCPNCQKKFVEGEYRIIGKWFECSTCGKQIKNPLVTHVCRNCENKFSFDDAIRQEIFSYSLSSIAENEVKTVAVLSSEIKKLLKKANYAVREENVLKGKSGMDHRFDFICSDKKKTIAIDVLISGESIQEIEIIKEQNKFYDTGIEIYLIVIPKLSQPASIVAKSYQLKIVESSNKKEAIEGLRKLLIQSFGKSN